MRSLPTFSSATNLDFGHFSGRARKRDSRTLIDITGFLLVLIEGVLIIIDQKESVQLK